jgi:starch synthase
MPAARVLFVNSGILGHHAVARLMADAAARMPAVDARHLDLSADLTLYDRLVRRGLSLRLTPDTGVAANLDLRRWRQELNVGLLASRRIAAVERQSGRADVLHFHTQAAAYASLGRMRRTPSIVSIDATQRLASEEMSSSAARSSYRPNIAHDRRVFRRAAAIVATSEWAARDLAGGDPGSAGRVHVMPYPVRTLCEPGWLSHRQERALRDPSAPVRVLFMGGDFPRKGGPDLLAAWVEAGLAASATLDLVTNWPVRDVPPGVRVVRDVAPHTPAWCDAWRDADVFVMPTRHEAFGMVFQEAAAAGLPVVATRINAIPEIVEDGVTGLLVSPGDRGGIARALHTLLEAPALRCRMGAAARATAAGRWGLEAYADRLGALIRSVADQQGRHA